MEVVGEKCDTILDVVQSGSDLLDCVGVMFDALRRHCAVGEFLVDLFDASFSVLIKRVLGDCIAIMWSEDCVFLLLLN